MILGALFIALLLAAGFAVVVAGMRVTLPRFAWAMLLFAIFASAIIINANWKQAEEPGTVAKPEIEKIIKVDNRPIAVESDGYVSSDKCRACHPHHYDTWHASHHRTMTQVPSKDSVIADFNNYTIRHSGREFRFFQEQDKYFMEMKVPDASSTQPPPSRTFEMVLSTGAHHQQAFWCATTKGRSLGKLPFIWITSENRWIPYGSIFVSPASQLSMSAGLWNKNCLKCHVVSGRPRAEPESFFDSHVAEFGISCEACHGPAEKHVAAHRKGVKRNQKFSEDNDPTLVNPADLSHEKSSQICGQCHAVFEFYDEADKKDFDRNGFSFRPGDNLADSRRVVRYHEAKKDPDSKQKLDRKFWSDGMVRVSGREYNGLLETACHQRGTMSCLSCHSMHPHRKDQRPRQDWADDQLKPDMRGNQACVQCHQEYQSEDRLVMHTHHPPDSAGSKCYNCHMPHTTLGLMKAMRSHTVDSPNVATTLSTGRPNACNLCHLDKTLAWTSEHLSNWYNIKPPELKKEEREIASSVRWILKGDAGQRAIAGWHYGWKPAQEASGTAWMYPYLAELLTDSYDVVRFIGYHSLKDLPDFADFEYDFVGSEESRKQRKLRALEIWNAINDLPAFATSKLIDEKGFLDKDAFQQMRNQRLDPPVFLAE